MLPRRHRATRHDLSGRNRPDARVQNTYTAVAFWLDTTLPHPKGTCTVSKKVHPRAASRNSLKRVCREALRQQLPNFPTGIVDVRVMPAAGGTGRLHRVFSKELDAACAAIKKQLEYGR